MEKIYTAMGLMSGTSLDGVDVSIIETDGNEEYSSILDKYFEYDKELIQKLLKIRAKITDFEELDKNLNEIKALEREITLFNSKIVNEIFKISKSKIDVIGFHGQTIFHDPKNKITKQLGDGKLLSQLTKKTVVYDFRKNDLKNDGQGAPLTPIFHNLLANLIYKKKKENFSNFLNIGGISNVTITVKEKDFSKINIEAFDIGPGNCLIDHWIRNNSNKKFDQGGLIAKSGKVNELILNQAIENFKFKSYEESLDIKEFDTSFVRGLSLEDGCATITNFTAYLIAQGIKFSKEKNKNASNKYLICGGGRKNHFLIDNINFYLSDYDNIILDSIDDYQLNGDYIESQAFGYLAIRSLLKLPISFPSTTRCKKENTGGIIVNNF